DQGGPEDIAATATRIFWTNHDSKQVMECAAIGCGASPTVFASSQATPTGIAVDAVNVYWTDYGAGTGDGVVMIRTQ
ncbi:MAG TPA: hypothetical protein VIJ22_17620, partial [Polyangiaceae bacterium]